MIAVSHMFTASALARPMEPVSARTRAAKLSGRQALRPEALVDVINQMLAERPECNGLKFSRGRLAPVTPDVDGCNWRPHDLQVRVAHGSSTRALGSARNVVELARLLYDLADTDHA